MKADTGTAVSRSKEKAVVVEHAAQPRELQPTRVTRSKMKVVPAPSMSCDEEDAFMKPTKAASNPRTKSPARSKSPARTNQFHTLTR